MLKNFFVVYFPENKPENLLFLQVFPCQSYDCELGRVEHLLLTKIFDRPETLDLGKRPSLYHSAVSDGDVF
jgi:hypothetical protein